MRVIHLILWFSMVGLVSCQKKPDFSLTENDLKMVDVLVDIYTADAALRDYRDLHLKDSLKQAYFEQLYQIHQVDADWVSAERKRLESDPVRMDSVYTRALSAIEQLKSAGKRK
ncbi:MAG TPA: hypothetical protein ENK85_12800 [Saprospiraceae bacterium]|nr:hypothetical protein [Saprospiraceae bacterium]